VLLLDSCGGGLNSDRATFIQQQIEKNSLSKTEVNIVGKSTAEKQNPSITPRRSSFGLSPTSTTGQFVKHKYFTISYSEKHEQAEWVFYKLTKDNVSKRVSRTDDFREDPMVTTESASLYDYKGSGYHRGHLLPAGSMTQNHTAMSETFYMSNMSPQKPKFNMGIWKKVEAEIRCLAYQNDSIFVVTGPILDNPIGRIGLNEVTVPRAYYKTVVAYKNGKVKGIGFIDPHQQSYESVYKYSTSIDEVEEATGIDFYFSLNNDLQNHIEKNKSFINW